MTVHDSWTVDRLVEAYTEHQRRTRGLRPQTLRDRARLIEGLVRDALGTDPIDPTRFAIADVVTFVTSLSRRFSPRSMRTVRSTLRSFFRFLRFQGFCNDELEAALPTVAHWRLATLPRSLTDQQVEQVLASFNVSTPCRQRNHAIVQCLSTLGLRPGEVTNLFLDDIDWRGGTIEVRTRKNPSRRRAAAASRRGAGVGRLSERGAPGDRRAARVRAARGSSPRQADVQNGRLGCRRSRASPGGGRHAARRRLRLPAHRSQPHGARGSQPQRGRAKGPHRTVPHSTARPHS